MKRNLTVQLDESTIQKARIIATRRSTSISRLVRDEIERVAEKDTAWQATKRTALTQLNSPFHLGGGSLPNREILHER